jgi:hypothetical protein
MHCPLLRRPVNRWAPLLAALGMAMACQLAHAVVVDPDDDRVGALMGDLMFHADLMSSLDKLCPSVAVPGRDWQAVVSQLPAHARTRELRDLSRRLSADASQAMVHGSGGCATVEYARVYAETRLEYEALLEQWAQLSV